MLDLVIKEYHQRLKIRLPRDLQVIFHASKSTESIFHRRGQVIDQWLLQQISSDRFKRLFLAFIQLFSSLSLGRAERYHIASQTGAQ